MQGAPEERAAPRTSGRTQASALRSNAADGPLSPAWGANYGSCAPGERAVRLGPTQPYRRQLSSVTGGSSPVRPWTGVRSCTRAGAGRSSKR
jgi:hypothetical protein